MKHLALNQAEAQGETRICSIPEYILSKEEVGADGQPKRAKFVKG